MKKRAAIASTSCNGNPIRLLASATTCNGSDVSPEAAANASSMVGGFTLVRRLAKSGFGRFIILITQPDRSDDTVATVELYPADPPLAVGSNLIPSLIASPQVPLWGEFLVRSQ